VGDGAGPLTSDRVGAGKLKRMRALPILILMTLAPTPYAAAAPEPITYTLRFPAPATHYVEVEAVVPTGGHPQLDLRMAVWTPGSYLVREYSRHVEQAAARAPDGSTLPVAKTAKNRWRVETRGADRVRFSYRVYGREMSVRTNYIDPDFALLNGAPTFITLADPEPRPHIVRLEPAASWTVTTALAPVEGAGANVYRADDFDTLADSPIVLGTPAVYRFEVNGVPHELADFGEGGIWNGAQAARDVERFTRAQADFWRVVPYNRYIFFNLITEAAGGLEHKTSTVLMTSRWKSRTRKGYLDWLGTASHELFHAWNVKRLRPVELGPFEYEAENYTRSLWIAEGVTEYYGDLLVRRAGISNDAEYLDALSQSIEKVQTTPGRNVRSVEAASFDAWIKFYRPDDNSKNTSIDYYAKGAVVGFLLDAEIRRASAGARTLDDVMRRAYAKYAGPSGYTTTQFKEVAAEVAEHDLSAWFHRAVESTEELDYAPALEWFGLRFRPNPLPPGQPVKGWLGTATRNDAGRLVVSEVPRGTPAEAAGLSVDDEIIAVDGYRVRADQWDQRMEAFRPGDRIKLLVARREQLLALDAALGAEPRPAWRLERDPSATAEQQAHFRAWLDEQGSSPQSTGRQ
jgi:predicted metalloprotease with PDZ domain